jgi:hypothetical protein
MTPQARYELEQAFLRILRAREPELFWRLLPDDGQPVLDGSTATGARSSGDDDVIEDGAE